MKTIFMGTPEFAIPSLEVVFKNTDLQLIFTKEDKRSARGNKIIFSPVKQFGIDNNVEIIQPRKMKNEEVINKIKEINPDLIVVVAYGKILPKEIIDIPKYGIINVHSSLLPRFRGAAPINAAIIEGDEKSGVSIMYVEEELDAGDVILQKETLISDEDTFLTLHDRLKVMGAELLIEAIQLIENEKVKATKQDKNLVTFVKPFRKEDCKINWSKTSREIFNFIRGMNPAPTAFSIINNSVIKIYETKIHDKIYDEAECGEVVDFIKGIGVVIKTKDGSLIITSAKPENKKQMSGVDLINGNFLKKGEKLC